jgi:ADP-L-glycero-D-manno-heptose 6-epimerase
MIVLTGGAGFIGSNLLKKLNDEGCDDILIVDSLGSGEKWKNLVGHSFKDFVHKSEFVARLKNNEFPPIDVIYHLGACSSTTEKDADYLLENNFHYSRDLLLWAQKNYAKFMYASSAATYGDGALGYSDENDVSMKLRPLNMYGYSKQLFDEFVIKNGFDKKVTGVKFFNVFGPNEYHKGDMCSMVFKAYHQILKEGKVKLFASNDPVIPDGEQKRDFVYVKDCVEILYYFMNNEVTGIYNLGTGQANSWIDLMKAVFSAMNLPEQIEIVEMPEYLRGKYQNFTQADMTKLKKVKSDLSFQSLRDSVKDYVQSFLTQENLYS